MEIVTEGGSTRAMAGSRVRQGGDGPCQRKGEEAAAEVVEAVGRRLVDLTARFCKTSLAVGRKVERDRSREKRSPSKRPSLTFLM